jgi:flagellar motor switch protein FliM
MAEILTEQEIDQLLTAIKAGDAKPEDFKPASNGKRIKIYDFKRPDKFSKGQIRSLSIIHDLFSRELSDLLSSYLRKTIYVQVASVDQLAYAEFIRSIPSPTTFALLEIPPLKGYVVMEIDPDITHAMINRLFGGEGNKTKNQHELTALEMKIMEDLINNNFLAPLHEAWNKIFDMKLPALKQIDTNPQYCQIVPNSEMVILVTLECKFGDVEGMINFCLPYSTLEPIIMNMMSFDFPSQLFCEEKNDKEANKTAALNEALDRINIPISVEVGRRNYTLAEIKSIKEGTILELDKLAGENVDIFAGGELIAYGEVLVIDENFGVRVNSIKRKTDVQPKTV